MSGDFETSFETERGGRAGKVERLDVIPLSNGNRGWTLKGVKSAKLEKSMDCPGPAASMLSNVTGGTREPGVCGGGARSSEIKVHLAVGDRSRLDLALAIANASSVRPIYPSKV